MKPEHRATLPRLAVVLLLLAPAATLGDDLPPFGPPLGAKADVVRSFTMKLTGAVKKTVTGAKGDGKTGLVGQCKPTTWSNFGIAVGSSMSAEQAGVYLITKGTIATGATGAFPLSKVMVELFTMSGQSIESLTFSGPGELVITAHDGTPGRRRLVGTITGKKLKESGSPGKAVDVEASFDMDFSCGVK
jgi:hypothetical protein